MRPVPGRGILAAVPVWGRETPLLYFKARFDLVPLENRQKKT
jgi:hypothetical protein